MCECDIKAMQKLIATIQKEIEKVEKQRDEDTPSYFKNLTFIDIAQIYFFWGVGIVIGWLILLFTTKEKRKKRLAEWNDKQISFKNKWYHTKALDFYIKQLTEQKRLIENRLIYWDFESCEHNTEEAENV